MVYAARERGKIISKNSGVEGIRAKFQLKLSSKTSRLWAGIGRYPAETPAAVGNWRSSKKTGKFENKS